MSYNAVDFDALNAEPVALTLYEVEDILCEHGLNPAELEQPDAVQPALNGLYNASDVFTWLGY